MLLQTDFCCKETTTALYQRMYGNPLSRWERQGC